MPPLSRSISVSGVYGRHNGVSWRRMRYGGDFTLALPEGEDEITFVMPVAGKVIYRHASDTVGLTQVGLALDKVDLRSVRYSENHAEIGTSIRRSHFTERLSTLLGKPIINRIRFEPLVDLNIAAFQGIKALLELATGNEFDQLLNSSALMPARLQEMLVDALLETWPHNYSPALQQPAPSIAPRHVKLAVEYIQEHPENVVSGAQLAELTNVSLRALQLGFRRFVGTSINGYQRQVRLERAHTELAQGGASSISEVALRYGFSHVGRFSQYFQNAYGLSPAQVKRSADRG
nr:AraC family transcriptional regulator [Pseudomonas sp. PB101]